MKLEAQAQTKLRKLIENQVLPASECGKAFLSFLAPLIESAVLNWQRCGSGRRLFVSNADALREFCRQRFPESASTTDTEGRVTGVGRFRDSKAVSNTGNEIISIRAWKDEALLKSGEPVGAAAATAAHGVFSFWVTLNTPYRLNGPCMLVENPAVFAYAEQLKLPVDSAIYGHGRISNRALDWIATIGDSNSILIHLPDYDPVGLSEFQRLHARLGNRVVLHVPIDLAARFERFSNRKLLKRINSQAILAHLRRSTLPAIRCVVELIDRYNAGLEQEALFIQL